MTQQDDEELERSPRPVEDDSAPPPAGETPDAVEGDAAGGDQLVGPPEPERHRIPP